MSAGVTDKLYGPDHDPAYRPPGRTQLEYVCTCGCGRSWWVDAPQPIATLTPDLAALRAKVAALPPETLRAFEQEQGVVKPIKVVVVRLVEVLALIDAEIRRCGGHNG